MNYRISLRIFAALMLGILAISPVVRAEDQPNILTDTQRTLIINNCTDLQATLNRIQQNDALARHDRGQLYLAISDKLMTPLNQRIASNQLDGSALVATTAKYTRQYQTFYNAYRDYKLALQGALNTDCSKQPTVFYDAITKAREKRILVHEASVQLLNLAEQYRGQFTNFRASTKQVKTE